MWVQVLESSAERLPAQWRDRCGPIMGKRGGLGGPSRLSERQKPAWCQLGWSKQTYASLRKILIKVHIDAIN